MAERDKAAEASVNGRTGIVTVRRGSSVVAASKATSKATAAVLAQRKEKDGR